MKKWKKKWEKRLSVNFEMKSGRGDFLPMTLERLATLDGGQGRTLSPKIVVWFGSKYF